MAGKLSDRFLSIFVPSLVLFFLAYFLSVFPCWRTFIHWRLSFLAVDTTWSLMESLYLSPSSPFSACPYFLASSLFLQLLFLLLIPHILASPPPLPLAKFHVVNQTEVRQHLEVMKGCCVCSFYRRLLSLNVAVDFHKLIPKQTCFLFMFVCPSAAHLKKSYFGIQKSENGKWINWWIKRCSGVPPWSRCFYYHNNGSSDVSLLVLFGGDMGGLWLL